jgi:glycosyltransferase involved in cell wall biosynthesis
MGHPISVGPGSLQQHPPAPLLAPGRQRGLPVLLGRADEEKGPHLAIEAARRAGRRLVMCVTTKNQRERSYWAEQVEPLLGDDVEVRGECDQTQKTELLARAAGLLFPIQ